MKVNMNTFVQKSALTTIKARKLTTYQLISTTRWVYNLKIQNFITVKILISWPIEILFTFSFRKWLTVTHRLTDAQSVLCIIM
jgi:hypothetical protein